MPLVFAREYFLFTWIFGCIFIGLQCFVCDPEIDSSTPCTYFNSSNKVYVKDCPSNSGSCHWLKEGNAGKVFARSCEIQKIQDCKKLDQYEYCYCTSNLCNFQPLISDDEDYNEGSGVPATVDVSIRISVTRSPDTNKGLQMNVFNFYAVYALMALIFV